ncbi:Fc receptor-like protein 5 [Polypterus senegalus]|uniref:Fc receptor-like protein 5 n=1 Tax=Polypterus senegalus TaxID=55291 RepID=UPI001965BA93|nr:Fc receptor-like protein 5 [Polypterus senegalus]
MWAVIFWVVSLLTTVSISDKQPELQKPVLTQVPKLDEVYTEEKVTLTCDIGEGWQYHWFKNNVKIQENASTDRYFTGKQYIFSERTDSLVVEYTCQGYRVEDNSSFSQKSDAVIIRVIDLPKPTLTHWPEWSPVYIGESVTLRCHSTWKYLWFKDDKCLSASGGQQDYNYTVTEDSDQAEYKCQGYNEERNLFSHYSTSFTLKVNELPKPVISHYPEWTDLYSGENMTIMCEFEEGWQYQWIKNGKPINTHEGDQNKTGSLYIITDPTQPKEQKYQCQGYNEKRKVFTKKSELVTLKISDLPKPTLKRQPAYRTLYEGDSVSLKCEVKGVSKYLWLKDGKLLSSEERVNTNGDTYNIKAATQSDNGVYGCQGFIEDRNVHTPVSKPLTLSLSELFTDPVLTIIPATSVFDGDPVILQCQSTSTKWETQLNYSFLKDEGTLHHDSKQNRIQIFKTSETDIGKYTCEVDVTGTNIKKTSNSVQLTVKGSNPKPVLTLIPPWEYIFTMETVSLVCQVDSKRDDWKYQWFKDGDDTPLPCNDNCNITRVTVSDEGRYWCRGKRGDPPVYSQTSNFVSLNISELPEVKLNLEPPHTQIFAGHSFTLRYIFLDSL